MKITRRSNIIKLERETFEKLNTFMALNDYDSADQFIEQILGGTRKLRGSKSPNNFRDFKCLHRHYVATCNCQGLSCSHLKCWIEARWGENKVGYLDIEVSQLHADFGWMISWCIKERDKKDLYYDIINKDDIKHAVDKGEPIIDKRIVKSCLQTLLEGKFDYVVAHYGVIPKGLDVRFLRTRAIKYGLPFPVQKQMYGIDTYPTMRNKLKLHSNRLDSAAKFLGCPVQKTEVSADQWIMASFGDKNALKYVLDHNKRDVEILEWVHKRLEPYHTITKTSL